MDSPQEESVFDADIDGHMDKVQSALFNRVPPTQVASVDAQKAMSEEEGPIAANMLFAQVIREYPQTTDVFLAYGLHCVGCMLNEYDTIEDAGLIHGINPEQLVKDLNTCVRENPIPVSFAMQDDAEAQASSDGELPATEPMEQNDKMSPIID